MKSQEVKKLAVVQLDGRNELLLSLPAINGLKKRYPKAKLTLIVSTECNELVRLLNDVEEVILVDTKHLADSTPSQTAYDLTVNLSFSDAGIVYSSLLTSYKLLGTDISGDKNPLFLSPWAVYNESMIAESKLNPFHRSDIYKAIAEVQNENCEHTLTAPDSLMDEAKKYLCSEEHLKIAIAVDALSLKEFSHLVPLLRERLPSSKLYFLGTLKSKAKADEILTAVGNGDSYCVNLCGKLSLDVTAAFLRMADILVDTEGELSYIASGYGTFTITIGHEETHTTDTCVYSHGHLIVARLGNLDCSNILAEILEYTAKANSGSIPSPEQWQSFCDECFDAYSQSATIHITQRISNREEAPNFSESTLVPLMYMGADHADCIRTFYKLLWYHELEGRNETIYGFDVFHETTLEQLTKLLKPLEQLYELAAFGHKYCSFIKKDLVEKNYEKAKVNSAKLQDVDTLIDLMADSHQNLTPVINFFQVSQSQIQAREPIAVAVETTKLYLSLQHQVLILLELSETLFKRIKSIDNVESVDGGV